VYSGFRNRSISSVTVRMRVVQKPSHRNKTARGLDV
jgi:hypothetical protein